MQWQSTLQENQYPGLQGRVIHGLVTGFKDGERLPRRDLLPAKALGCKIRCALKADKIEAALSFTQVPAAVLLRVARRGRFELSS